jgi:hypothetical protein
MPRTRAAAKALGATRYFTGKPCKHGHTVERLTASGHCTACFKIQQAAYRANDPERYRERARRDLEKNRDTRLLAKRRRREQADPGVAERRPARQHDRRSRREALASAAETYTSLMPCKRGHVGLKYTKDYGCVVCHQASLKPESAEVVAARLEAKRIREEESVRHQATVRSRADAISAGETQYLGAVCRHGHVPPLRWVASYACVECGRQEDVKERKRKYDGAYRSREDVAERLLKQKRVWVSANADLVRSVKTSYKVRRRAAESAGDTSAEIGAWLKSQKKVCHWCNAKCAKKYHVDHYEPLSKGGKHEVKNLVIACPSCNLRKNAKDPYEFAKERGRLF